MFLKASAEGNWRYGFGYDLQVIDKRNEYYSAYGGGPGTCTSASGADEGSKLIKVRMRFPDGGVHEFRPTGEAYPHHNQEGYYDVEPNGRRWYCRNYSPASPNEYVLDSYAPTYEQRTYYSTDGTYLRLDVGYAAPDASGTRRQYWTLYLPGGGRVVADPYLGAPGPQRVYDRNDNHVEITSVTSNSLPATRIADQLGRSITVEYDTAARQDYVRATGSGGASLVWTVKWKSITVNKTYGSGIGTQNLNTTLLVVESVTLPAQAGGLAYSIEYNAGDANPSAGWGEVSALTLPSGARSAYTYRQDNANNIGSWAVVQNHPTRKDLTYAREYDGAATLATETWQHSLTFSGGEGSTVSGGAVTAPDGGMSSEVLINNSGHWDHALPAASERPDGTRVERRWMANTPHGEPEMNPYVKTEFISIRDAAGALVKTAIKDYAYDKNGNVTSVREYDWVPYSSVHDGAGNPLWAAARPAVVREAATGYYAATPDASDSASYDADAYHRPTSPRKRDAASWAEVRDASRTLSRAEFFYDDPTTKGNLTQKRAWDSSTGATRTRSARRTRSR